jgi:hypothetical protein
MGLILQIDTGETGSLAYVIIKDTCTSTILTGDSVTYTFQTSYTAPWHTNYYAGVIAYMICDSSFVNGKHEIMECVNTKDLRVLSIDNPTGTIDNVGNSIQVTATFNNRSDGDIFNGIPVTYLVTNSQGVQTATSTENITIGLSATVSHTFNVTYAVPADSVYYLAVYLENRDNYPHNDTMLMSRKTNVGIETLGSNVFNLGQNVPNPATNSTRIDYSIPESGEVIFHLHSANGQLLDAKTIEAASGKNSLEFNTNTFAAGIYFYSIEYKGQRLIKRMSVQK